MVYTFDMLVGILLVIMMTNGQALVQGLYIRLTQNMDITRLSIYIKKAMSYNR